MAEQTPLELETRDRFEAVWRWVEIVVSTLIGLFLLAGLAGLVGPGPLGRMRQDSPRRTLGLSYDRYIRVSAAGKLILDLHRPEGQIATVHLDRSYLDRVSVKSTSPRAISEAVTADGIDYAFGIGRGEAGRVFIAIEPKAPGPVDGAVSLGGDRLQFHQFVYP